MKVVDVVAKDLWINFDISLTEADRLVKGIGMCRVQPYDQNDDEKKACVDTLQKFSEMIGETVEEVKKHGP